MHLARCADEADLRDAHQVDFVPIRDKHITWCVGRSAIAVGQADHIFRNNRYNCGPTVYDASHMGHARCVVVLHLFRRF